MTSKSPKPPEEVVTYYEHFDEANRLFVGVGRLEFARTKELVERYLPPPPAVVLDVGGGAGAYACWLARKGYEVHLFEPVSALIDKAKEASEQSDYPVASITIGDARKLDFPSASADALLLFGPLYHLVKKADRVAALREAARILRPAGLLFGAVISRFASTLDGLRMGFVEDPRFVNIMKRDLAEGQHRNPTGVVDYWTTAYFHRPEEVKEEMGAASLNVEDIFAVEGPGWLLHSLDDQWDDPDRRERFLDVIRSIEKEPSVLGTSAHILAVAKKNE